MLVFICGKGGSGKDTLLNALLKSGEKYKRVVSYTTRPKRGEEQDGLEYHFIDLKGFIGLQISNFFLETRDYHTAFGVWKYGTPKNVLKKKGIQLLVGPYKLYQELRKSVGKEGIVGIYLDIPVYVCVSRMLKRCSATDNDGTLEVCRRAISDSKDFSNVNLKDFDLVIDYGISVSEEVLKVVSYLKSIGKEDG